MSSCTKDGGDGNISLGCDEMMVVEMFAKKVDSYGFCYFADDAIFFKYFVILFLSFLFSCLSSSVSFSFQYDEVGILEGIET